MNTQPPVTKLAMPAYDPSKVEITKMPARKSPSAIRHELTISIHPYVSSFDKQTGTHSTDGRITLAVEEREYEVLPSGRRKPVNLGQTRSIAWEQHETYASAMESAVAHSAAWHSEQSELLLSDEADDRPSFDRAIEEEAAQRREILGE